MIHIHHVYTVFTGEALHDEPIKMHRCHNFVSSLGLSIGEISMMDEGRHDKEKKEINICHDRLQLIEFCTAYK